MIMKNKPAALNMFNYNSLAFISFKEILIH
jgi:hypothetical protein